ncbi:pyridoxamine 5'-phosphate oxidase family protein [Rhodobacter sp.]
MTDLPSSLRLWPDLQALRPDVVLCWLATADAEFGASTSPKEIWALPEPGRLVVADIASGHSVANIRRDPRVCVSLIDVLRQRGFKLYGRAEVIAPDHPHFDKTAVPLLAMTGGAYPIRHVIAVSVTRMAPILAPSYALFPERPVAQRIAEARAAYGLDRGPDQFQPNCGGFPASPCAPGPDVP